MVGRRFGKRVVTSDIGDDAYELTCDCGTVRIVSKRFLQNPMGRSCGCAKRDDRLPPIAVGDVFERFVVVEKLGASPDGQRYVRCACLCGNEKVVREAMLRNGHVKSCGCLRRQRMHLLQRTHGESSRNPDRMSLLYRTWISMLGRAAYSTQPSYDHVGIDPQWRSYEVFRDYVRATLGPRPPKHSLDRVDNTKGYQPGNVRWSTSQQQARNRRNNVIITVGGVSRCVAEWAALRGFASHVIHSRLRNGWSPERAVTEPKQEWKHRVDPEGYEPD